ncbi:sensor histidine kinase [Streptomyces sp. NBC_00370]|uniref:sensor histidine kinase n=1 Tax=Streptomyces sp. NBC_00370 TaxID=2975728 RepID=UPI002E257B9B
MRPSLRPTAPALLISAAVCALLCLWAVSAAPASVRTPLAWGSAAAAVALTAAVTVAAHALWTARQLREHNESLAARADQFAAETRAAKEETRRGEADVRRAFEEAAKSAARRAAAVSVSSNAAGRMQALATGMLADLREMENRHADEDVLADLLHLDHRTAQAGRLADSVAVLTGARSGRRWAKPIVMESILRGAMGRISGYQRVRLHSTSDAAVAGHAAEGVMHALAELLDNAANFSPPTAEVHVYVEEVPAGIVITVEDSGLVMSDVQLRRAERAVGSEQSDLTGFSGTRLGLAVVGRLARKHGLTVSFRPSARGGTGALLMLPQDVLTQLHREGPAPVTAPVAAPARRTTPATAPTATPLTTPAPAATGRPATSRAATAPSAELPPEVAAPDSAEHSFAEAEAQLGDSGLPKRRRGRTLAAAQARTGAAEAAAARAAEAAPSADSSTTQATRFGRFRDAVRPAQAKTTSAQTSPAPAAPADEADQVTQAHQADQPSSTTTEGTTR